jgi:phage terminase large subunit-like protein
VTPRIGLWNRYFLDEAETFPLGVHDDQIDAASLALEKLAWV